MRRMLLTGLINVEDLGDAGTAVVLNNLLDADFKRFMHQKGWEYIPMPEMPMFWVGYIVTNSTAIAEIKQRADKNPWFAFRTEDKYP